MAKGKAAKGETKGKGEKKKPKPKIGGNKSYEFTPQADILLGKLKKNLKSTRTKVINEAVVHYARANGIKVEGEMSPTAEVLAEETKRIEGVVDALCEIVLAKKLDLDEIDDAKAAISKAVAAGTTPGCLALKKELGDELPKGLHDLNYFRIYANLYGLSADD